MIFYVEYYVFEQWIPFYPDIYINDALSLTHVVPVTLIHNISDLIAFYNKVHVYNMCIIIPDSILKVQLVYWNQEKQVFELVYNGDGCSVRRLILSFKCEVYNWIKQVLQNHTFNLPQFTVTRPIICHVFIFTLYMHTYEFYKTVRCGSLSREIN